MIHDEEAAARILRQTEKLMGNTAAVLRRHAREFQAAQHAVFDPNLLDSYSRQAREALGALGGAAAIQRTFADLTTAFGPAKPRATSRTYPVTVEEQEPEQPRERPQPGGPTVETAAPSRVADNKGALPFIVSKCSTPRTTPHTLRALGTSCGTGCCGNLSA